VWRLPDSSATGLTRPIITCRAFHTNPVYRRPVDAFSKMVAFLYKLSPEGPPSTNGTKLNLLNKVLDTMVRVLIKNHDTKRTKFNQRPFYRLFASLLIDLNTLTHETDPSHLQVRTPLSPSVLRPRDSSAAQVLMAFSNCLMILSPVQYPGFCFAWLELVSHSQFMPKLLLFKSHSVLMPATPLRTRQFT